MKNASFRMFKIIFTVILICSSHLMKAQTIAGDKILGEWLSEEKDTRIEIYKTGTEYFGRLTFAEKFFEADGQTFQKDANNTTKTLRSRSLQHIDILHNFTFTDDIWDDGKMYDPKSGKTYSCLLRLKEEILEIRSYVGIPLFGRSTYWTRVL
jgi:uncharacterized protein (DUF2147 family)